MKVVVIGGHLSPAFSVIQELEGEDILLIGRKHPLEGDKALSLESQFAQSHGITFKSITTGRLQRRFTRYTVSSLFKFPKGLAQAMKILRDFKPDIVIGFGGYLQVPIITAAYLLGIPTIIHEQTLEAGFANRVVSGMANRICISWDSSRKYFPKNKVVLTGNPIRKEIIKPATKNSFSFKNGRPVVYVTGGSLGSHKLNVFMEKCIRDFLKEAIVIHQTGDSKVFKDFDRLVEIKQGLPGDIKERYVLNKFFTSDEVSNILREADLVVSRSGINIITELLYLQKPAFLIPLSFAQKNEQHKNALMAKDLGLAEVGTEKLTAEEFFNTIKSMLGNLSKYKGGAFQEKDLVRNAAARIKKVIWETARV